MDIIVGVESWIIQDGNYGDFQVGDVRDFALEFCSFSVVGGCTDSGVPLIHRGKNRYFLNAVIDYVDKDAIVIDFGVKVFQRSPYGKGAKAGQRIEGEFSFGIDPFFYFEELQYKKDFPNLSYRWRIEKIEMETTPLIEASPKLLVRDQTRVSYEEIQKTDAWEDFNGNAFYLLHCVTV